MTSHSEWHRDAPPPEPVIAKSLRWVADQLDSGAYTLKPEYLHQIVMDSDSNIVTVSFHLPLERTNVQKPDAQP